MVVQENPSTEYAASKYSSTGPSLIPCLVQPTHIIVKSPTICSQSSWKRLIFLKCALNRIEKLNQCRPRHQWSDKDYQWWHQGESRALRTKIEINQSHVISHDCWANSYQSSSFIDCWYIHDWFLKPITKFSEPSRAACRLMTKVMKSFRRLVLLHSLLHRSVLCRLHGSAMSLRITRMKRYLKIKSPSSEVCKVNGMRVEPLLWLYRSDLELFVMVMWWLIWCSVVCFKGADFSPVKNSKNGNISRKMRAMTWQAQKGLFL